ncbi:MAG: PQQ-dependent sugar dehydrogenase, partial [Chitinophagaceae bacterium]|nr:PQQ-dependent sugar dehydrogenase [Chitinophagaceae bacterium]
LSSGLNEPLELDMLPNGDVLFIERGGAIKIYDQQKAATTLVDSIAIRHGYTNDMGEYKITEEGLYGLQVDPGFEQNHFIYLYYSPAESPGVNTLVRFEFRDGKLLRSSKKVILEVPVERELGWLTGGSIAFDGKGNLYLGVGSDTDFGEEAEYSPADERPGRSRFDAQRTAGNTNDLRGHILRIHPEPDGSYTIPAGNLFPKGMPKTRPEIYAMGNRNPHRLQVDRKTGYLYWGNVGPDAGKDSALLGPQGYDEFNQAKEAGNFGWPYFTANNIPYVDYDFATHTSGAKYDPNKPVNPSPNNTGLTALPPASPAFIWYAHAESKEFPLLGSGGQIAMPGPVFYSEDFKTAKRSFPAYYNGKLLIYDGIRGWIMAVTMDRDGNYAGMEPFMGSHKFNMPMDMAFGKDGDLYLLQYGRGEPEASLLRIEYTAGNRKPVPHIAAEKTQGAVPFTTRFSAKGTVDDDRDALTYQWNVKSPQGKSLKTFSTTDIDFTFDQPGEYQVELMVNDGHGGTSTTRTKVQAGNEPPQLSLAITRGNTSLFTPGKDFAYAVTVSDHEDGSTESGAVTPNAVRVTMEYLPGGYDQELMAAAKQSREDYSAFSLGKSLVEKSDCKSCHSLDKKTVGPAFMDVANRYQNDPQAPQYLSRKIREGGKGVWGDMMMVAHPLPEKDVAEMVRYILGLAQQPARALPLKGSYITTIPKGQPDQGVYLLRASYTDRGANGIPGIRTEQVLVLRNAVNIPAAACDESRDIQKYDELSSGINWRIAQKSGAYIAFKGIDLSGIGAMTLMGVAPSNWGLVGGQVELRIGSPEGALIGRSGYIVPGPTQAPMPAAYLVPIKPQAGRHDLYFVCTNDKAAKGQDLFMLSQVKFQMGAGK